MKKYLKKRIPNRIKQILRRIVKPKLLYFISNKTKPLSNFYGFDRGTPIDRFYIEKFLEKNENLVHGVCLELLNNNYTVKFGKGKVTKSDILDIEETNKNATIIDDLRKLQKVSDNSYDCIILTQVLQFIDDVDSAISECYRVLKQGGAILVTLPSISRIDCLSGIDGDYWRFTSASARYLFEKRFAKENITISTEGNARSGIFFYAGMSLEETPKKVLYRNDPNFPLIVTVKAIK